MSLESGSNAFKDKRLDRLAARMAQENGLPSTTKILAKYFNQGADAHWGKSTSMLIEAGRKLSTSELKALDAQTLGTQTFPRSESEMVDIGNLEG